MRERVRFRIVHYSVQGNHVHLLVEAASAADLACGLKSVVARFARAVNRVFQRVGQVLADRCHVHVLRTPREARNAVAYVLLNARRHAAKRIARMRKSGARPVPVLARAGILDAASSARWFFGWRRDVEVDRSPPPALGSAPAVARPRTFYLRAGWQKAGGLLDPNAVPGGVPV